MSKADDNLKYFVSTQTGCRCWGTSRIHLLATLALVLFILQRLLDYSLSLSFFTRYNVAAEAEVLSLCTSDLAHCTASSSLSLGKHLSSVPLGRAFVKKNCLRIGGTWKYQATFVYLIRRCESWLSTTTTTTKKKKTQKQLLECIRFQFAAAAITATKFIGGRV